ncbi:hypothetical protein WR25_22416 [Diploscapter pachys]|uniref:Protein-tyrosine-phosphatase n=1 Tax=Diploscapter pachys TaxID=2018661 RepID=A0A2A2LUF0_9BILA|nr:hypothetical protein WR25_22416 [Diploscapter pachys]
MKHKMKIDIRDIITDAARQWWVAHGRYELIRPFYALRIEAVKPEDSGTYRCRLETDPLFSLTMSTAYIDLTVLVKPVPPSSPTIKEYTNHSVTLTWTHQTARAHRPIKRFAVAVRSMPDDARYVIAAPSNSTSVIVDNLSPFTLYGFAVRAENAAGNSEFGPETTFRTLGEAPKTPPIIESITNASVGGCVTVHVRPPQDMHGELNGYVIYTQRLNDTEPRKQFFTSPLSSFLNICGLHSDSSYVISIEADNGFGISPAAKVPFETEASVPNWVPQNVTIKPSVERPEITIDWSKEGDPKWKMESLNVEKSKFTSYSHRLINLAPDSEYKIRLSASSYKGEGKRSQEYVTKTDYPVPTPPEIKGISFDCKPKAVFIKWTSLVKLNESFYVVELQNASSKLVKNVNLAEMTIKNLSLNSEYSIRVFSAIRSRADNKTLLKSPFGTVHRLVLKEECEYSSSLCNTNDPNHKCLQLAQQPTYHRLAFITIVFAFILFFFIVILIARMAKNRSVDLKLLLKKKEKCVYLEEVHPLVYDPVGFDDIPVELFYGVCEDLGRNNYVKYKAQFEQIEKFSSTDNEDSAIQSDDTHLDKNRYLNIGAIDATRIRINSSTGSDYINANYIDSTLRKKTYIATQAPLPSTFADFWCMIWQERCNVIVMITNLVEDGRRKCDQYWPSVVDSQQVHGIYQISLLSETINAHFSHRILSLKIAKSLPPTERKIHQLHFIGWPDHGVPTSVFPLLNFINYVSDIHTTGSIVVHCRSKFMILGICLFLNLR